MDTIEIPVIYYYRQVLLYPHMTERLFNILHDAFLNNQERINVNKDEFQSMLESYFATLKN
jgi:hypothetical protein